ncbi:unnamed protein product [Adineta ricciae]|uniref:G-protein coupled receptors family 1 profile domain-containing protein n=1 Tax=Adineta ricciae TaxID=249248 RepID=A0A814QXY3_ADIRI|nr:unnamed protein product [Adineta ricciae]CAF1489773.1 unnamed protein product [Adineta ricciae]
MNNSSLSCAPLAWSATAADAIEPSFYVCIVAVILHSAFWLSILVFSSLRQWESLQWLYAFLILDLLLLIRFFILYGLRTSPACVSVDLRTLVCYFEGVGDIYLNMLQGYVLLALNICRHYQITRGGADIYTSHRCLMLTAHILIYIVPLILLIIEIKLDWAVLYRRPGNSCDLDFSSPAIQIFNTIFGYIFPVGLTLIYLFLSLRHVRRIAAAIRDQQISDTRLKHHRLLVFQSITFYSVWLLLWSPHVIISQFVYVSSTAGAVTQILNYIELTSDPLIIAALDVRFLKVWKKTLAKMKTRIVPIANA